MARQHPRNKRVVWETASRMPQELVEQGVLPHAVAHQNAHPWCWSCGAPGKNTVTAMSRQPYPAGGTVTFYTLCERCTDAPHVRQRITEDMDRDEVQAAQIRSN